MFVTGLDACDEYQSNEVCIRPNDKHLTRGYVKFFNKIDHPKHIKEHELWVNLSKEQQEQLNIEIKV